MVQHRKGIDWNPYIQRSYTVMPRYLRGIGSRTPEDTKICGCSSPSYKMPLVQPTLRIHESGNSTNLGKSILVSLPFIFQKLKSSSLRYSSI